MKENKKEGKTDESAERQCSSVRRRMKQDRNGGSCVETRHYDGVHVQRTLLEVMCQSNKCNINICVAERR